MRLLKLRASFLPFVQFPEKDNESEEDNGELILSRRWKTKNMVQRRSCSCGERERASLAFRRIMPK